MFRDVGQAQTGLDRDRQRQPFADVLKETFGRFRIAQKPCSLALCNNRSGRSSHISLLDQD